LDFDVVADQYLLLISLLSSSAAETLLSGEC
jgi:hypothetical protein